MNQKSCPTDDHLVDYKGTALDFLFTQSKLNIYISKALTSIKLSRIILNIILKVITEEFVNILLIYESFIFFKT